MKYSLKKLLTYTLLSLTLFSSFNLSSEAAKNEFLVLNNPVNSGFGAVFSSVLSALNKYEQEGYAGIKVDLNSGIYVDPKYGPNWWEYFFEPINLGNSNAPHHVLTSHDVSYLVNAGFLMTRERGFELIQKYVRLKPHIQLKILNFMRQFKNHFVIGIHHRGTDKAMEAPIVSYETTLSHVNWWIANLPKDTKVRIFIATDDQNFLDYFKKLYPNQVIYNHFVRSKNGNPIHYNDGLYRGNYQKGEEAVLDCLLLSKCNILLFPAASAFSMAALKFNPHQTAIPLVGK